MHVERFDAAMLQNSFHIGHTSLPKTDTGNLHQSPTYRSPTHRARTCGNEPIRGLARATGQRAELGSKESNSVKSSLALAALPPLSGSG